MTALKRLKRLEVQEGAMFGVPLVEGAGFGFGCIALARKGWGFLFDIFDHVAATPEPPADIEDKGLVVHNQLGGPGLFVKARYNPDPWRLLDRSAARIAPIEGALFRIGSKVFDMRSGEQVQDPAIDREALPEKSYPLDNQYSYMVTARLLRRGFTFDEKKESWVLTR